MPKRKRREFPTVHAWPVKCRAGFTIFLRQHDLICIRTGNHVTATCRVLNPKPEGDEQTIMVERWNVELGEPSGKPMQVLQTNLLHKE